MGLEFRKLPLVRDLVMQHEGRVETRSAQLAKKYSCRQQRMTLVPKDPKLMDIQGPEVSGKGKMSLPPTRLNSPMSDPRPFSCTITPIRILASSEEPTNGRRQLSLSPARQGRRRVSSLRQKSKKIGQVTQIRMLIGPHQDPSSTGRVSSMRQWIMAENKN